MGMIQPVPNALIQGGDCPTTAGIDRRGCAVLMNPADAGMILTTGGGNRLPREYGDVPLTASERIHRTPHMRGCTGPVKKPLQEDLDYPAHGGDAPEYGYGTFARPSRTSGN